MEEVTCSRLFTGKQHLMHQHHSTAHRRREQTCGGQNTRGKTQACQQPGDASCTLHCSGAHRACYLLLNATPASLCSLQIIDQLSLRKGELLDMVPSLVSALMIALIVAVFEEPLPVPFLAQLVSDAQSHHQ